MSCKFDNAWQGNCGKHTEGDDLYCLEHKELKCCSCGEPATHTCSETGQFVCGAPLCDDCEHTTFGDGTNGGIGFNARKPPEGMSTHCKKTDQKHKPWYAKGKEES